MNPQILTATLASKVAILGDQTPLTISEVAKLLNRSEATIHRLIAAGKLKKTKINRSSYVQLCHVKSLLSGDTTEVLA
ncbi:helix-turn-helix domain-containing protein [Alcaligenes faecalis]|uniref:helix-turn-helix domain-containing protein n=1 Tax=Alcaligenes faecalis TaxID=511 RepID=UPI0005A6E6C7|nr:helix-turn-helix domain-containing protein [Alcaligenes faecalis]ATI00424.1 DNA-binding protein [Alcaligenes faecalis]AYZ93207.1 DNA-binding protein [Alcaligenes faecalis]MCX5596171.1 helix-turn-helix domain-containing protein [Alcaligenes faecalis]QQC30992.1 helix-turn-helix domain-containing protein [Alcaligenes faecalis]CAJ0907439.1 DNA-binding protein [Alcaligenes faecalis subsp. faecalis]